MKSACSVRLLCLIVILTALPGGKAVVGKRKPMLLQQSPSKDKNANISQAINQGSPNFMSNGFVKVITKSHVCGGIWLFETWVLTTASCIRTAGEGTFALYLGYNEERNIEDLPYAYASAKDYIEHPKFHEDMSSDKYNLNLVLLEKLEYAPPGFSFSDVYYELLVIDSVPGTTVQLIGLGQNNGNGREACVSLSLLRAELTIKSMKYCSIYSEFAGMNGDDFICAASDTDSSGACKFDEGGPVTFGENKLIGMIGRQQCPPSKGYPTKIIKITNDVVCWLQTLITLPIGATCIPVTSEVPETSIRPPRCTATRNKYSKFWKKPEKQPEKKPAKKPTKKPAKKPAKKPTKKPSEKTTTSQQE